MEASVEDAAPLDADPAMVARVDAAARTESDAGCSDQVWRAEKVTLVGHISIVKGSDEDGVRRSFVLLRLPVPACLPDIKSTEREVELVLPGDGSDAARLSHWSRWVGHDVRVRGEPWTLSAYLRAFRKIRMMVRHIEEA
jgi:hypothetical protein